MNDNIVITVENLSKKYRLGQIGATTLRESVERWWHKVRGRDPTAVMGEVGEDTEQTKSGEIWALKDVSFEVKRGEVLGIIGRNGAGKSTLLKILTRITEPTSGRAILRGRVASLLEVGTGFHPELTGRENIYLNGAILGMKKKEIDKKFDEIVAFAEVEKFIDTPVKRYSSGMYVRLAFAVAAHLEAEILFVDEVLAVGDASFQQKCISKMGDVAKGGRTVLLVSHSMGTILKLCQRVVCLQQGKVVKLGEPNEVVNSYLMRDTTPMGEAYFNMEDDNWKVRLLYACSCNLDGEVRKFVNHKESFRIKIKYEVKHEIPTLRIGIKLYNQQRITVLHSATCDRDGYNVNYGSAGINTVAVAIPSGWLTPGRYYVEIGAIALEYGKHFHRIDDAFAFEIINPECDSIGEEVLRGILKWEII